MLVCHEDITRLPGPAYQFRQGRDGDAGCCAVRCESREGVKQASDRSGDHAALDLRVPPRATEEVAARCSAAFTSARHSVYASRADAMNASVQGCPS